ncbi:MAG: hypothetical protein AAF702_41895 [Chloroflexota bacterium]
MNSHTVRLWQTEQPMMNMLWPNMLSLPWLVCIFGIPPLLLAFTLTLYAYHCAWFTGIVFGLAWMMHITVFMSLIYWVNKKMNLFVSKRKFDG